MTDLRKILNPAQYEAATTIDQPVLVIAGAGSGKTRVIEYRTLHLIENGVAPESILLLTFTRKAAKEMLDRVIQHDKRAQQVDGGTFHAFGFKLLKRYAKKIGLDNTFSILDQADSTELVAKGYQHLGFLDKKDNTPKKQTARNIISMAINKQRSIKDIVTLEYPSFEQLIPDLTQLAKLYTRYKLEGNYVDYDDLLVYLRTLLESCEIRELLTTQYAHVMVDEYQDTNKIQGDIAYWLGQGHGRIMAVGDDAQSIYGFRGATHSNILDFPNRFDRCKVIKLEENYRSRQEILDVGNAILQNMAKKYEKKLISRNGQLSVSTKEKPRLTFFKHAQDEATWVAEQIQAHQEHGISLAKQAVLFRSAYISIPLQTELSKREIPFQVYGGLRFYETAHVKDIFAHLKLLTHPADELAWRRVLLLLAHIGPKTVEVILETTKALTTFTNLHPLFATTFAKASYAESLLKLAFVLEANGGEDLSPAQQFRAMVEYYKPILKTNHDDWQERLSDLETLISIASGYSSLDALLADFALEPPQRASRRDDGSTAEEEMPLTLSTIHSAKGLEWEVVYVIGLIDGVLPSRLSIKSTDQVEEESRLFYVAVTRAKQELYLSMHHQGSGPGMYQFNRVSRFLETPNLLKTVTQRLHQDSYDSDTGMRSFGSSGRKTSGYISPFETKESLFEKNTNWFE